MSIKVKVGASKSIRSVPKQDTSTPIVAAGEKKPVIVPDSIVLGTDTLGPYVATIDAGPGIIVTPEVNNETANLVISHINSSDESNTINDDFGLVQNIDIDEFGHVTRLQSSSLDSLNFTANGSFITAKDITLGTTALTIGESTNRIQGLDSFNVGSIEFANNTILSANSLIITTNVVNVNSTGGLVLPVGTAAERPTTTVAQGMIRYNTTDSQFEGYDGTIWKGIGGVIDSNQDTKILAESSPGVNNDQLQFYTFGVERMQLDSDGQFKYGSGLNKVLIDYDTGNTFFSSVVSASRLKVLNLIETAIVFAAANGELSTSDQILWDGVSLVLKGGLSIDGDFSTEGGLSGDSLSVGNLSANTIVFIGEGGVLQSNTSLQYDGFRFDLTTPAFFNDDVTLSTLTENRIVIVGENGLLEDSSKLSFNGNTFFVDGDANITGSLTLGGNITVGNQEIDTIEVIADFTSNLIPRDDNTYTIGKAGSNWNAVYATRLLSDTGTIMIETDGAIGVPVGNTAVRPSPALTGMLRFNTTDLSFEGYDGSVWKGLGGVSDVNQDTKIVAETSPGVNNDELEFYTAGVRRFLIGNTGVITTDANTNLVFNIGGGIVDIGNSIITGVLAPVNSSDAVNLDYLENTFSANVTFVDGSNNYTLSLLENPIINTGVGLEVISHSGANNSIQIAIDKTGVSPDTYGRDGFVPQIIIGEDGRIIQAIDIPLSVSSNAVVDFTESISDVVISMLTGNVEEGITVTTIDATDKINLRTNDFTVTLTGAVTGSNTVVHNSNTVINTEFDYATLDERYLNANGDISTGDIQAPKFVDSANTIYWAQPGGTSRFRNLIIGYGQTSSLVEMKDGSSTSAFIYAGFFDGQQQIGFLNDSFNYAAYANRTDSTFWVRNEIYASRFVDRNNTAYFVNPASTDTKFRGLNVDNSIIIGVTGTLTLSNTGIISTQDLILNPATGIIDANTSIIKNVSNPVDSLDAVNKQYLETELNTLKLSGINIAAESGNSDVISLGETITFAAGDGIDTLVSNNQILISANTDGIFTLIKTVDGSNSGLDADLLDGLDSTQFLRSDTDDTMIGNLTIQGNLTVQGNTTYVNTEEILLSDNTIVLNANFTTGTPTENAGIEIERGDETNVVLQWNETDDYWEISQGGTTGRILTTGDEGANNGLDADLLDGQEGFYYLDYNNFFNVPPPEFDLTLTGKVTGTAFSNTGVMTLATELSNTGVTPGTYGSSSQVPVITIDEDGRITLANTATVAGVSDTYWTSANNTFTVETADGGFFFTSINEFSNASITDLTSNNVTITSNLTVNGNIIVAGTVDGRDIAADGIKLDGIEANATSDMTATEILEELKTVDGANSGLDADLLDGEQGSYYLDYNNFFNVPPTELTLTIQGKVTGSGFTNTGVLTIDAELSNTGVIAGTYGSASLIPIFTVDEDGRITSANSTSVAAVSNTLWYSSNNTFEILTADGGSFKTEISTFSDINVEDLTSNSVNTTSITTDNLTVNGDIIVTGTVDGRDVAADGIKLDGIEANATSDMTATEILDELKTIDGANSGLDADLLDGQEGSYYLDYDNFTNTPDLSANAILTLIKTVDGENSGLDADLLDGYNSSDFFNYANNLVSNTVNDAEITIAANTGLSGGGSFTLNQISPETITISHADTSSQANVSFSNTEAIASIDFDDFGHVVSVVKRTSSFLSEADADLRYVNVTGDVMTGDLEVQANILQNESAQISVEETTNSTSPSVLWSFEGTTYGSAEVIIVAKSGINKHITKLLIVHDGTNAYATEFATIYTNASLASYEVEMSLGNPYILVTPASSASTTYKIIATVIAN